MCNYYQQEHMHFCILHVGILNITLSNTLIRGVTPLTLHGRWVFSHWSRMPLGQHHTLPTVPLVMVDHSGLLHAKDNFLSPKKKNNKKIISENYSKSSNKREFNIKSMKGCICRIHLQGESNLDPLL